MKRFRILLLFVIVLALGTAIVFYPEASSSGAKTGLFFCTQILIPSLFPFMVLSAFIVKSGLSKSIGRVLDPLTNLFFHLPGCAGATIIISLIGGYPTGARGIKALVDKSDISPIEAERMLFFCVGAGPAFVINVIGCGLLGSLKIGIILFLSQIFSSLAIGIMCGFFSKESNLSKRQNRSCDTTNVSDALVEASSDSVMAMLNMCAFVILFSTLLSKLNDSGFSEFFAKALAPLCIPTSVRYSALPVLLEVTSGCKTAAILGASPEFISFALGFSGLCVHFQISSSMSGLNFSKLKFTVFRIIHGLLSAFITHIALLLFPESIEVFFSTTIVTKADFSLNAIGTITLIMLCSVFLFSLGFSRLDLRHKK